MRQKEQKGLADAIRYAENFTGNEDFVVLLGDTIYESYDKETVTSKILEIYQRLKSPVIAVEKVPQDKIQDYGIIRGERVDEDVYRVSQVVEKPEKKMLLAILASQEYTFLVSTYITI